MRKYYFLFVLTIFYFKVNSQELTSLKEVITNNKSQNFYDIASEASDYFKMKYSNKNPSIYSKEDLIQDGEWSKFNRWFSFWSPRLNKDGTFADLSKTSNNTKLKKNALPEGSYALTQWQNVSYNQDLGNQIGLGRTSAMAFHPTDENTFYVGAANGGIWRTTDGGTTYTPLGDDLPYLAVSSIIVDQDTPSTIYIAISDRVWYGPAGIGVYKSTDSGATWNPTALTLNFSDNVRIYWMEANPSDPDNIFVATEDGLYHTTNGFDTVSKIANGIITDVKFKPGDSNTLYYVSQSTNTFYKSTDGGTNFSQTADWTGSNYMRLVVTALNSNKVFVTVGNNLHTSTNSGTSFSASPLNLATPNIAQGDGVVMISPANENHIYAGFFDFYKSSNGGSSFNAISHWLGDSGLQLIHVDFRNAFINPLQNDRIYLCNDGGVYSLNVNNDQFTNLSNGLIITQYYDIATSQTDENVVIGGSQDNGNVFRESNGIWSQAAPTADGMHQEIDPTNANIRYNSIQNGVIYRFINGVRTTISNNISGITAAEWVTPYTLDPNTPSTIIAGYNEVFRSTDQGNNWSAIGSLSLPTGRSLDLIAIAPSDSRYIYALENYGASGGVIFNTNGYSRSDIYIKNIEFDLWTPRTLPVTEPVLGIIVDPNDATHLYASLGGYTDNHKVFESLDGGNNWQNISGTNLPNVPAGAIAYYDGTVSGNPSALFLGTDNGVYYKEATMTEWEKAGNFPNTYIADIEIQEDNNIIRVGTHGRGILEADLDDAIALGVDDLNITDQISIYPNPTTGIINIKLPENSEGLYYSVINIEGQVIKDNTQFGKNFNQINIGDVTQGIYFVQITDGRKSSSYKIIKTN